MSEYYIEIDGKAVPCDISEWAQGFGSVDRTVARTELALGTISTVFLGLDHSYGDGPPMIYETLVFGGALEGEMERYSTREEAVAGHAAMVERVRATGVE